ncbi:hypothetical protein Tcan_13222 [Toxocara canis]|uniref:Uncharacterized protein n=1 Tax=Toxocara canis TaxID=6265 RepID=A0A0B2VWP6_TOXCA|nr:hypothetical protein Tcan_13222 [Toxocara canis]
MSVALDSCTVAVLLYVLFDDVTGWQCEDRNTACERCVQIVVKDVGESDAANSMAIGQLAVPWPSVIGGWDAAVDEDVPFGLSNASLGRTYRCSFNSSFHAFATMGQPLQILPLKSALAPCASSHQHQQELFLFNWLNNISEPSPTKTLSALLLASTSQVRTMQLTASVLCQTSTLKQIKRSPFPDNMRTSPLQNSCLRNGCLIKFDSGNMITHFKFLISRMLNGSCEQQASSTML